MPKREAKNEGTDTFPVVAVGASAGGIEAFQAFLGALAPDTGMAFVFILHLPPDHESTVGDILSRSTPMPVFDALDGMRIEPNKIYVMPPGKELAVTSARFRLEPRPDVRGAPHSIDHFMCSIAETLGERSIGVVLSGTGSDGARGVAEIKAAGGITFAQDESAQQTAMPKNAVALGGVDSVMSPGDIARELARIAEHPFARAAAETVQLSQDAMLGKLFELLHKETGVEFGDYRRNTILRRVLRHMALRKVESLTEYVELAEGDRAEVESLSKDLLINVTRFFRDPTSFDAMAQMVFPRLTEHKARGDVVRIWVPGCSTGQDAYSIAMAFTQYLEKSGRRVTLQVFATDVNAVNIERARTAVYPKAIEKDLGPQRLRRFFTQIDGSYRIAREIREMCVFARHDVLTEPPFSRIDLVVCRNLLIYLEPVLQRRLLPILHYALKPGGFLWLGSSETAGGFGELFHVEDAKNRIYSRNAGASSPGFRTLQRMTPSAAPRTAAPNLPRVPIERDRERDAERLLLARYAPPAVVVDEDFSIVRFRGDTTPYLVPPQGRSDLNLLRMLREGLLVGVRGALHRARREMKPVREEGLRLEGDGTPSRVDIVVMPIMDRDQPAGMLVVFEQPGEGGAAQARQTEVDAKRPDATAPPGDPAEVMQHLQQELTATREYLQSVVEQLEAANEELQASNEEAQSSNEELQSVNEELETSKEEIQSSNEELTTVNEELQTRNTELAQSNSDLANLIASVQMPLVMLDLDLRIRRFTPAAEKLLNLLPSDVGRPFTDIKLNVDAPDLEGILARVLESGAVQEREVLDRGGRWQWLTIRPYRDEQYVIKGAILLMIDIDVIKRAGERLDESERRFARLADSAPVLMWVDSLDGFEFVNRAYEEFAGMPAAELEGWGWVDRLHSDDREEFLRAYREATVRGTEFEAIARFRRADGAYRWMKSIGVPRHLPGDEPAGYVGSSIDITDLKEAEEGLRRADRAKDEFLATLGHELRNPLAAISNATYALGRTDEFGDPPSLAIIERQTRNMVRIVDDLLDITRIKYGKINLRVEPVNVEAHARDALAATEHERRRADQTLETTFPHEPLWALADPSRLEQVLVNLLSNASRFAPRRGKIRLAVERAHDERGADGRGAGERGADAAVIRVSDDGPGIDPGVLPRIFELFVQGERTSDRARSGVGIGLALAHDLVELQGGTIAARNLPAGGAEIVVRLRAEPAPAPAASRGARAAGAAGAAGRNRPTVEPRRVMIVDDNEDAASAVQSMLELSGHAVRTVRAGKEALAAALEFKPDVIVLDIGLPDIDGFTVARQLRADKKTRAITLFALTGYGRTEDAARALEAGFDRHIAKPADPEALLEAIAEVRVGK